MQIHTAPIGRATDVDIDEMNRALQTPGGAKAFCRKMNAANRAKRQAARAPVNASAGTPRHANAPAAAPAPATAAKRRTYDEQCSDLGYNAFRAAR